MCITLWNENRYFLNNESCVKKKIVLPVLEKLGWNTSKSSVEVIVNKQHIDIKLIYNELIFAYFECKSLNSHEFRIRTDQGKIKEGSNQKGDGVAQLKYYYHKIVENSEQPTRLPIPVITNGLRWVIFNPSTFLKTEKKYETITPTDDISLDIMIGQPSFLNDLKRWLSKPPN